MHLIARSLYTDLHFSLSVSLQEEYNRLPSYGSRHRKETTFDLYSVSAILCARLAS
jgi:hypothetical protein